jgi:hypothetical protein
MNDLLRRFAFALSLFTLPAVAAADEIRLNDGRVLVGAVREVGDTLEIQTRDGTVVVPKASVARRTTDQELQKKLADSARGTGDTAFAHLQLAMQARGYGLEAELWHHLDRCIELHGSIELHGRTRSQESTDALERRLSDFLSQLEPELLPRKYRAAPTPTRVQQLLDRARPGFKLSQRRAVEELLVREPDADQHLRREARSNGSPHERIAALSALRRRPLAGNDRFVLRTAVLDGSADVRRAAVALGKGDADAETVSYMASGLAHENGRVRVRTAEALGELGHPAAVGVLVRAAPHAAAGLGGDGAPRAHIAFLEQQAYVRDFDVEVASNAFIADPKIANLQSGAVLDVTVVGVVEVRTIVRTYRAALQRLTGSDPGADVRDWPNWQSKLPAPQEPPQTGGR